MAPSTTATTSSPPAHPHSHARQNWSSTTPLMSPKMTSATASQRPQLATTNSTTASSQRAALSPTARTPATTSFPFPPSVGQAFPPQISRAQQSSNATDPRTPSPNYFGFIVDSSNPPDSNPGNHAKKNWDSPQSARPLPSAYGQPQVSATPPVDTDPRFEMFRRQSEKNNAFSLGSSRFSNTASTPGTGTGSSTPMANSRPRAISNAKRRHETMTPYVVDSRPFKDVKDMHDRSSGDEDASGGSSASGAPSFFDVPTTMSPPMLSGSHFQHLNLQSQSSEPDLKADSRAMNVPTPSFGFGLSTSPMSLSLPPRAGSVSSPPPRAQTLNSQNDPTSPPFLPPQQVADILRAIPQEVLLLDLRVYPQYSAARIRSSLNLCIPTTLLKRPTFDLTKLTETFAGDDERARFANWRNCKYIVAYDASSSLAKDAASSTHILKKFSNSRASVDGSGEWKGQVGILRGGFAEFSRKFPNLVDTSDLSSTSSKPNATLSLSGPSLNGKGAGKGAGNLMPVLGGCPMPASKTAANPFFGNIRQNMDLIGGVGQMSIKRPSMGVMTKSVEQGLPTWLKEAIDENDGGKKVAEKFLEIEQTEQKVMTEAFSVNSITYSTESASAPTQSTSQDDDDGDQKITIAGIEKGAKNRYNNILPYDHSRVKLKDRGDDNCDYINASHVKAKWSEKTYIATQAPIPATFADFWRLIWEQDARLLIMLTADTEGGQIKSDPYWHTADYGPFKLKMLAEKRVSLEPGGGNLNRTSVPGSSTAALRRAPLGQRRSTNPHSFAEKEVPTPSQTSATPAATSTGNPFDTAHAPKSTPAASDDKPYVTVRHLTLSHTQYPFLPMRGITQIQYAHWPDFGTPAQPAHLLALIEICNEYARRINSNGSANPSGPSSMNNSPSLSRQSTLLSPTIPASPKTADGIPERLVPEQEGQHKILVHCSAGCGRTGTFCTVDSVIDMIKRQEVDRRRGGPTGKGSHDVTMDKMMMDDDMDKMDIDSTPKKPRPSSSRATSSSNITTKHASPDPGTPKMDTTPAPDASWPTSPSIDLIAATVSDFRSQRLSMVQSLRQFVLCYESVLEWIVLNQKTGLIGSDKSGKSDGARDGDGVGVVGEGNLGRKLSSVRRK